MTTKGFIELLRLSDQIKKGQRHQIDQQSRWSGVAFEIFGTQFVAPLGDVEEVIHMPDWTPVPNTQAWICGVSNIRGRMYSLSHLSSFLGGTSNPVKRHNKVLCLNHLEHNCGVLVDRVFGIQHFDRHNYYQHAAGLPVHLQEFCQGYFVHQNKSWHVFLLRNLFNNQKFLSPFP